MATKQNEKQREKWRQLRSEIIEALDLRAECEKLGIEFTRNEPNSRGWLQCWAFSREHGDSPNAGVNLQTGQYNDFGERGETLSFFDLAMRIGNHKTFRDVIRHYAKEAGIHVNRIPKQLDHWSNVLDVRSQWNPLACRKLCQKYGIGDDTLQLCGARIIRYPKSSPTPQYLVGLPIYGTDELTEGEPVGWQATSVNGDPVSIYKGPDAPEEQRGKNTWGGTGLMGRWGLAHLASAEIVYKVEGFSDLLALQEIIPADLREKHIVIANAGGATEKNVPYQSAIHFAGKTVVIIGDADEPGQTGAGLWINALWKCGVAVKNFCLPYPVEKTKGKDLRDWLAEGHTYADLLRSIESLEAIGVDPEAATVAKSKGEKPPEPGISKEQEMMNRLGIIVSGNIEDGVSKIAVGFSRNTGQVFQIRNPDTQGPAAMLLNFGADIQPLLNLSNTDIPGKYRLQEINTAIGALASRKRINPNDVVGAGVWEMGGKLAVVGNRKLAFVNSHVEQFEAAELNGRLVDFEPEDWLDFGQFDQYFDAAKSPEWRQQTFTDLAGMFERWDNWGHAYDPQVCAGLAMATWIQAIFDFRPLVYVVGETNVGKTTLYKALEWFFSPLAIAVAQPTEAAIRQEVGRSSKPILIDEFEKIGMGQKDKIFHLLRTSTTGQQTVRGTIGGHRTLKFGLKHIVWLWSTVTDLKDAADRNRFCLLHLKKVANYQGRRAMVNPTKPEMTELGIRSLAVMAHAWQDVKRLWEEMRSVRDLDGVDNRVADAYGLPVAVMGAVQGWSRPECMEALSGILQGRGDVYSESERDEHSLVQEILMSRVWPGKGQPSVSVVELLRDYDGTLRVQFKSEETTLDMPENKDLLNRHGIAQGTRKSGESYIAFDPKRIKQLLAANKAEFAGCQPKEYLMRLEGAEWTVARFGKQGPQKCAVVPAETVHGIAIPEGNQVDDPSEPDQHPFDDSF